MKIKSRSASFHSSLSQHAERAKKLNDYRRSCRAKHSPAIKISLALEHFLEIIFHKVGTRSRAHFNSHGQKSSELMLFNAFLLYKRIL